MPEDFAGMHSAGRSPRRSWTRSGRSSTRRARGALVEFIRNRIDGLATSATIGYRGYRMPAHQRESRRLPRHSGRQALKEGDIVNIDVTVIVDGGSVTTCRMYLAGKAPLKAQRLMEAAHDA